MGIYRFVLALAVALGHPRVTPVLAAHSAVPLRARWGPSVLPSPRVGTWLYAAWALALTGAFAWLTWRLVERPVDGWRARLREA